MAGEIIIDSGHGGFDNGASYRERKEKEDTLKLALAVGQRLEQDGYPVIYTRMEDIYQSPYQKAEMANQTEGAYFISFHRNYSVEDNLYQGVQALIYDPSKTQARLLGENINRELESAGFKNLGVEAIPELIVLRETKMPAVLMEVGFINSDGDNAILDEKFQEVVEAIVRGIEGAVPMQIQAKGQGDRYYVQTGRFQYDVNAAYQLERIQMLGFEGVLHYREPYYCVWAGWVETLEEAVELQEQLRENGYSTLIVTGDPE